MSTLLVACGTYDGAVFALTYQQQETEPNVLRKLNPVLLDLGAHSGPVTAIDIRSPYIVSGSTDEAIQLFSVPAQMRLGSLDLHSGTIRHLEFSKRTHETDNAHLFSASDDGCIAIWRLKDPERDTNFNSKSWECIRLLRRHKGPVLSLAVHPSMRCAFSISEDKTFRIWNLLRGRQAYASRLKLIAPGAEGVDVSPSGRRLLFYWSNRFQVVDLFSSESENEDTTLGCCIADVLFPQPSTTPPVFFSEDDYTEDGCSLQCDQLDSSLHVITGFGPYLTVFRCFLLGVGEKRASRKAENFGEVKLPGKRIKAIRVTSMPEKISGAHEIANIRSRLVAVVTTESSGSHIRGYLINLCTPLAVGDGFIPVFMHDISGARVTSLAVQWTQHGDMPAEETGD